MIEDLPVSMVKGICATHYDEKDGCPLCPFGQTTVFPDGKEVRNCQFHAELPKEWFVVDSDRCATISRALGLLMRSRHPDTPTSLRLTEDEIQWVIQMAIEGMKAEDKRMMAECAAGDEDDKPE